MNNARIARALSDIAGLLEIRGENVFKIRAYRNAARTVAELTRPLSDMVGTGADLTTLPGIGREMASHITELVRTGRTRRLDQLEQEMPGSITELVKLPGLGPGRVRALHDSLGIASLRDLERALEAGDLARVPGFGPKTIDRLRRAVHERRTEPRRFRLADADRFVESLLEWMRPVHGLERIEAAGSWRRRAETVGDVDLLAICEHPAAVMERFITFPGIDQVLATGPTRGSIVLATGLQVDLRVLPRESWGAALHYFTGSKAHNVAVRLLGVRRGLRISEYGVFRVRDSDGEAAEDRIGGAHEKDIFDAVGMAWVAPELREDRGEIPAALDHALPALVTIGDIRGDLHMHSTWSDGRDTIEAMARGCIDRGYHYMAICDHSATLSIARGLDAARLERQWEEIDRIREMLPGIAILRGMEVDILEDGTLDLPDSHLGRLDIVVASVHSLMRMSGIRMTDRVIRAMQHPRVRILGHPTGRLIGERPPFDIDVDAVLRAAAELAVAVEVNALPYRLDLNDVHLRRAKELDVRIVIDTDAHSVAGLARMAGGVDQARRGWIEPSDVVNTMSLADLRSWLERRPA